MKIKGLIAALSLLGFNLAHTAPIGETPMQIKTRTVLVGLWAMQIPENNTCTEYYNFKSDNSVFIKSDQEWSYGRYQYQPTFDEKVAPALLTLNIVYDNNKMDCSKRQEDQSGDITRFAVTWKDQNQIAFCQEDQPKQCLATLRRVLP